MYFLFSGRLLGRNTTSFSYLGAPATRTFSLDMAVVTFIQLNIAATLHGKKEIDMFRERIEEHYGNLTPGFRRLADFILNQTLDVAFLTATELSPQRSPRVR